MKAFTDSSAERYLVGALVMHGFEIVSDLAISPFEFADDTAQRIWTSGEALHAEGKPSTYLGIAARLGISAQAVLAAGAEEGSTAIRAVLEDCAARLRECYIRRRAMAIGKEIVDGADLAISREKIDRLLRGPAATAGAESLFADVQAILDNGLEPERPTVAGLLYAGRLNEIHAEPAVGKSNLALAMSLTITKSGGRVLYLDPEDSAPAALRRLVSFGAKSEDLIGRFHHIASPAGGDYATLGAWCRRNKPQLVVVDGLAEAMAGLSLDEDRVGDFLSFCRERLTSFTDSGAAVLISDHVVKSAESRGRWSRGTGAKMGRYDGVSLAAEVGRPYSPTSAGFVRLKVAKDRNGGLGTLGQLVAEVHFVPGSTPGRTVVEFRDPPKSDGDFRPTGLMEKVCRYLVQNPEAGVRALRTLGKAEYVEMAISELEKEGFITRERQGQRIKFSVVKSYREDTDEE